MMFTASDPEVLASTMAEAKAELRGDDATLHVVSPLFASGSKNLEPLLREVVAEAVAQGDCPLELHLVLNDDEGDRIGAFEIQKLGDFIGEVRAQAANPCKIIVATVLGADYIEPADSDDGWAGVKQAYQAIVDGVPKVATSTVATMESYYTQGAFDLDLRPTSLYGRGVADGDAMLFFDDEGGLFTALRSAIVDESFDGFSRGMRPRLSFIA